LGAVSPSITVKAAGVMELPRPIRMLEIGVITGAFTIWIGTDWTTVPLVPPADQGVVSVSVSRVAVGLATSSKS
jgi:hypothetical protein